MARKVLFRINLDAEKDADVIEALNRCPRPLRGEYVAEAIRLMREHVFKHGTETKNKASNKPDIDFGSILR